MISYIELLERIANFVGNRNAIIKSHFPDYLAELLDETHTIPPDLVRFVDYEEVTNFLIETLTISEIRVDETNYLVFYIDDITYILDPVFNPPSNLRGD